MGPGAPGCCFLANRRPRSWSLGVVADAVHLDAGEVRPVTGRIGGDRFERFVGPPGPAPADPEAIRTDGGCWVRLGFV